MLVYLCKEPLLSEDVGVSGVCYELNDTINQCKEIVMGGWAVGGEVRSAT